MKVLTDAQYERIRRFLESMSGHCEAKDALKILLLAESAYFEKGKLDIK